MDITPEQQKELKTIQIDMLKDFLHACQTLNLTYFIAGGTLLGAIRHKGFIPWDDDIDILMPRKDYDIFLKKGQALLPEHCFLQTLYTDPEFPGNYAKIRNSNTTFVETSARNCNINHGVYIDVFPLDYCPEDFFSKLKWSVCNTLLNGRIEAAFYYDKDLPMKSRIKHSVCKILVPSLQTALRKRDMLIRSMPKAEKVRNCSGPWGKREIIPAWWCDESCQLEFEGIPVNGPKEYHQWLTHLYGDYMQLPPVEKRVGHHYVDVMDLHTPYTVYRDK